MLFVRRRSLIVPSADRRGVATAAMARVDAHVPSERHVVDLGTEGGAFGTRITFATVLFDSRPVTNWNVYLGISRGHIDVTPDPADPAATLVTSTLHVRRAMAYALLQVGFLVVVLSINRLWIAAGLTFVIAMPLWALMLAEGYVGTFQRSLWKAIDARLADDPRRGFDVVTNRDAGTRR